MNSGPISETVSTAFPSKDDRCGRSLQKVVGAAVCVISSSPAKFQSISFRNAPIQRGHRCAVGIKKTACGPLFLIKTHRTSLSAGVISPARAVIRGTPSPELFCIYQNVSKNASKTMHVIFRIILFVFCAKLFHQCVPNDRMYLCQS